MKAAYSSELTDQVDWRSENPTDAALVEDVVDVPDRDTVSPVIAAPTGLEGVMASLTFATKSTHP